MICWYRKTINSGTDYGDPGADGIASSELIPRKSPIFIGAVINRARSQLLNNQKEFPFSKEIDLIDLFLKRLDES